MRNYISEGKYGYVFAAEYEAIVFYDFSFMIYGFLVGEWEPYSFLFLL